jgi:hypothetical protein
MTKKRKTELTPMLTTRMLTTKEVCEAIRRFSHAR